MTETPPEALAAFLASAEYAILQAPQDSEEDASEALIAAGCWYAPRLLAAVEAALAIHTETAGKCASCLGSWPCGEYLSLSRALLGEGE